MAIKLIIDHEVNSCFYTFVYGKKCSIDYYQNGNVLEFNKTYVPPSLRHMGIASSLAKKALGYAKENNLKVRPICSFVEDFIEKQDEFKHLLDNTEALK